MTTRRQLACLAAALLLSACGGGGGDDTNNQPAAATPVDLKTVRQVIDPVTGGSVRADGLALDFPSAALGSKAKEVALVTRSAASGAIASFRLEPAGQRLKQPVMLSYTAEALPANARFFWNIDGALTLMPGTRAGNTLSTTITSLGYAAGGKRQPLSAPALMRRLGADGRSRALAEGGTEGSLEVRLLQCEEHAETLRVLLNATDWQTDADRAIALHDDLVALRESCGGVQLRAIEQRACSALTLAVDNASVFAVTSMPAFKELVTSLHAATAIVQSAGATCAAAGGVDPETRAEQLIEAKFDQLLSFVEARVVNAGFAGAATQAELTELMGLEGDCERLGLDAPCARIANELYPRVLDILRSTAFDACRATGAPEPSRLHALGQTFSTPQKFFGFAGYGPLALETDAMYCTNPGLSLKVFENPTTLPEEIVSRAKSIDALGGLGDYHTRTSIKVPPNGSLQIAGRVQALRCADGTQSDDRLEFRLSGQELARYTRAGDGYTLATQPLDFLVERDLARLGLPAVNSRTLTLVRVGGGCEVDDTVAFNDEFTLFTVTLDLTPAAEEPPPVVPPPVPSSAWSGQLTLRYDFSASWDEVNQRADACGANDLDPATVGTCRATNAGTSGGSIVYALLAKTPAAIDIGATSGELSMSVQSVTGSMSGALNTTMGGTDGPCTQTGTIAYGFTAAPTSATPRRNWGLAVGVDGVLTLSTLSTGARPSAIDTTLRNSYVGSGRFQLSSGCPTGARDETTGNSQDNLTVLLPPGVFTGNVDPGGSVWQGSQSQRFERSGVACQTLGNVVMTLLQLPGHTGTATCTATLTATWDLQRQ